MSFCCDRKFFETILSRDNISEEFRQKALNNLKFLKIPCEFCIEISDKQECLSGEINEKKLEN